MDGVNYQNEPVPGHSTPLLSTVAPVFRAVQGESSLDVVPNLTILYYNARSILPKIDLLRTEVIAANFPSVVCIVESWLSEEIQDNEICIHDYQLIRLDRNRLGGGVLVYIHNSLTWEPVLMGPNDLELMAISVSSPDHPCKHCISVLYRPPSSAVTFFDNLCTAIQSISPILFSNFVLIGDFNINFCTRDHPYFCKLNAVLELFSLSQVVSAPTHTAPSGDASLIDLALVSDPGMILNCTTVPPLELAEMRSYHNGVKLELRWKVRQVKQVQQCSRTIWRYANAEFGKAKRMVEEVDWDSLLPEDDVDLAAANWHNKVMEIMHACIPQQTVHKRRNVPWLTKNVICLMRKRNAAFQAAKRSPRSHLDKFRKLRNKVVSLLRNGKRSYLEQLNAKDKRKFWKAVKFLNKQQSAIPPLHYQGTVANTNHEKAALLNGFFTTCFNTAVPPLPLSDTQVRSQNNSCPEDLLSIPSEVLSYITALDPSKASGPDGLSGRMLKGIGSSIAPSLSKLFNISLKLGRIPSSWKTSSIVPIPKNSNHKEATNYRPISLLPIVSKLLERHVHRYITLFLSQTSPLSNTQWGFQTGKSTITALLAVTHDWFQALEAKNDVCSVFFDLKKAFDSVPHQPLMEKLQKYGLDGNILSWISSYLTNRKQHVVVDGATSTDENVLSGVPQGSVLGPLLFLIYIDDVTATTFSDECALNLFADDMLLYKIVKSQQDLEQLQSDIDKIHSWVNSNHLTLNPAKCKFMFVSRRRNPIQPLSLKLNGLPLEQVENFKYLGVLLSSDMTWSAHVESICSKARRLVGLLYRRFSASVDNHSLLEMYKLLVRPHMEYAAPVWSPHLAKDKDNLEKVQKFALRMCHKNWDAGYQQLLELSELPTLENRRLYLKLCTLYKIIYDIFISHPTYSCPSHVEFLPICPSCTNHLSVPIHFSHLLYPAPSRYGTTSHLKHSRRIILISLLIT